MMLMSVYSAAVSGNWYLLGVPFLIKTRRMLDGMDTGKTLDAACKENQCTSRLLVQHYHMVARVCEIRHALCSRLVLEACVHSTLASVLLSES